MKENVDEDLRQNITHQDFVENDPPTLKPVV